MVDGRNFIIRLPAIGIRRPIIPAHGFVRQTTTFLHRYPVLTSIDAIIIGQFIKLPDHFWSGRCQHKPISHRHAGHIHGRCFDAITRHHIAKHFRFISHSLFVVTHRIPNQMSVAPSALLRINAPAKIVAAKTHHRLVHIVIAIAPQHHALGLQHLLLAVIGEMLQNGIRTGRYRLHRVVVIRKNIDARLVVGRHFTGIGARVGLRHPFAQIEAKSIHMKLVQQIGKGALGIILGGRRFMVEIIAHIVRVLGIYVQVRTVAGRFTTRRIPIHVRYRCTAKSMVINHIQNHSDTILVTSVYQ